MRIEEKYPCTEIHQGFATTSPDMDAKIISIDEAEEEIIDELDFEKLEVEIFEFSIGGFHQGDTSISIYTPLGTHDLVVTYRAPLSQVDHQGLHIITRERTWFLETLYDRLIEPYNIFTWENNYVDPCIDDGTQWELRIISKRGDFKQIYGSNLFPNNFDEFLVTLQDLLSSSFGISFGERVTSADKF